MSDRDRVVNKEDAPTGNLLVEEETNVTEEQAPVEAKPSVEVPEKFKGKELDDIIKSYSELEKQYGKQAQELGETRKLADQLVQRELQTAQSAPKADEADDEDEFDYDNPLKSIDRLVEKKLRPVTEKLSANDSANVQKKLADKHPDFMDVVQSSEFGEWVNSSPVRQDLYSRANVNLDFNSADELLSTFKALHPKAEQAKPDSKAQQERVNEMTTESGSSGQTSTKVYKRKELINLRATNPKEYWARADEFKQAYVEGRVR